MALDQRKYETKHKDILRDIRPFRTRVADWLKTPTNGFVVVIAIVFSIWMFNFVLYMSDFLLVFVLLFFWWLSMQDRSLAFKLPYGAKWKDKNNAGPGRSGKGEGILFLGNVDDTNEEVWFTNSDIRTHILYLGTTGAGKTEGLKSLVSNALTWGSGFVYVDGKADTDLWSSLSSLVRRFGRDDDLLVLNYMTGNADAAAPSNTMNPFSSGSASYLTNMLVSLMPDAEGDNAMWKERAVSLIGSLMPAMTWKRDNQDIPMSVSTIREYLTLPNVIKLSRDQNLPEDIRLSIKSYLDTLPGYVDAAFDDDGKEKPAGPNQPQYDTTTPNQQHGYLSMQFTRALQSLGDDYGYIFDTQAADVDMMDVVLNRRILVVLIPALEKSSDEIANLGKIVAATLKGMMGATLGATVEGESATVIENKPTHSSTPFMTVFDEVGYYTAQGMAVMAAQARSLGFCLVFSGQDLPAMKKRVREEANSITANCNIKIFGKLEDPTETKDFFEKTVGQALVTEVSGYQATGGGKSYFDSHQAGVQLRPRASYDGLRKFQEGQAVITFGEMVVDCKIYYSNPGHAKAMRVTRFISLPPPDENMLRHADTITKVRDLMVHKTWTALKADVAVETPEDIKIMAQTFKKGQAVRKNPVEAAMAAVASVYALHNPDALKEEEAKSASGGGPAATTTPPPATAAPTPTTPPAQPPQQDAPPAPAAPPSSPISQIISKKQGGEEKAETPAQPAAPPAQETPPAAPPQQQAPLAPPTPPEEPKAPPAAPAGETGAASGGGPMSFFTKKPPAGETPEQPPAAAPPQEQPSAVAPPPVEPAAPPPETKQPETPAAPPAPEETGSKAPSWEELVKQAKEQEQKARADQPPAEQAPPQEPAPPPTQKPEDKPAVLDEETEKILKGAGETARKAVFKDDAKSDKEAKDDGSKE